MSGPINHQTPPPTSSSSSPPGPIAQHLVQLQGVGQAPPTSMSTPGKAPSKKGDKPWKEMREWLNIIGVLLIPLLIGVYTIINNTQQTTLAQQQHDNDQHIAQQNRQADVANQLDQQRETALKTYEDDISGLLLDRHLATSRPGDEVRTVALAKTLEVLHQLDGPRNVRAIQFLQDAQLIGTDFATKTPHNIIDFSSANLANDDLSETDLSGANLIRANLNGANLTQADLTQADLTQANLIIANLNDANLTQVILSKADLSKANLSDAFLGGADLSGAVLNRTILNGTVLIGAYLKGANLSQSDLSKADLSGAIMPNGTKHSCRRGEEDFCTIV